MSFTGTTTINSTSFPRMTKNGRTLGNLHDMGIAFGGTPQQNTHQNGGRISFIDAYNSTNSNYTRFIFNGNGTSYTNNMAVMPPSATDMVLNSSLWEVAIINNNKG
jgi:hypothetical protein